MAIVLAARRYGRYTTVCQLRAPGDASEPCRVDNPMRKGRLWAACKGKRANLVKPAPVAPPKLLPLVAPPTSRRSAWIDLKTLWRFLGRPGWRIWVALLERAGVPRRRRLSHAECRLVMETRYRELGAKPRRLPNRRK